jgi:hypothetical protein
MSTESLQPIEIQREALAERLQLKSQWENQKRYNLQVASSSSVSNIYEV